MLYKCATISINVATDVFLRIATNNFYLQHHHLGKRAEPDKCVLKNYSFYIKAFSFQNNFQLMMKCEGILRRLTMS